MPGVAILGTALTTHAARTYAAWIGGVDVSAEPATPVRYWTRKPSVTIDLAGPGGVSTAHLDVADPSKVLNIQDGQELVLMDLARDVLLFRGVVDRYRIATTAGGVGRIWSVDATGVEAIADWYLTTVDLALPTGTLTWEAVQAIVGVTAGVGQLRAGAGNISAQGDDANPVGKMGGAFLQADVTVPAWTTLREAINIVASVSQAPTLPIGAVNVTVDHKLGLRVWARYLSGVIVGPDPDAGILTGTVANVPEGFTYDVDAGGVVRGVVVIGTGVQLFVPDGTGKPGRYQVLRDASITTVKAAQSAGTAYLADYAAGVRGTMRLSDWAATDGLGALDVLQKTRLTNALDPSGVTTAYMTGGMRLTLRGDDRDVELSFGGPAPSAAALLRRLTRGTLS